MHSVPSASSLCGSRNCLHWLDPSVNLLQHSPPIGLRCVFQMSYPPFLKSVYVVVLPGVLISLVQSVSLHAVFPSQSLSIQLFGFVFASSFP